MNNEETTINIQDLFNERVEQNKRIEELVNINEKLSLALESAEQRIDKAIEYIKSNEWAKDYELSSCRTHLLDILYNNKKNTLPQHSQQLNPIISKLYINNELQYDLIPKEDKKIEKLGRYAAVSGDLACEWTFGEKKLKDKINEIIDKVNGEDNE